MGTSLRYSPTVETGVVTAKSEADTLEMPRIAILVAPAPWSRNDRPGTDST